MAAFIDAAEIASREPAVDYSFGGHFRIVQVVRHNRLAADRNFADAFAVWIQDTDFHPGNGPTHSFGTEGLGIVQGDGSARLRAAVAVVDGNAEVMEKLNRRGLGERAADKQGT